MTQALAFPTISAVGSIDAYIAAAKRFPILGEAEEFRLATRFREENDLDAARQLVLSHLRLVISIARGYLGYGLPHADLIQEGNIGLMKAVKRFDPRQGVRLVSFAIHWIKAEIHEYVLRNWRLVKLATTKAQRKLFFNLRGMKPGTEALTPGQAEDIARRLNVKPEEVVEMETRLSGHDIALEADGGDEEGFAPIAYLEDSRAEPTRVLEARDRDRLHGEGLRDALSGLDERSRHIVEARWLSERPATLQDLADEYGVSAERIRQIEAKAIQKMKTRLLPQIESRPAKG
ncbi:MAG: RNA polymerase sigma factor RpoH [Candidatus Accumulibacter sp.]|jgi:RNA polymerase sigma-32 factor|nr:RNA polymerase sigma factor RpoH [Accumulibacter sp.]